MQCDTVSKPAAGQAIPDPAATGHAQTGTDPATGQAIPSPAAAGHAQQDAGPAATGHAQPGTGPAATGHAQPGMGCANANAAGVVFDMQRFSIHDGHGIRTLVFLKGCPLKCEWCANPESQLFTPQLAYFADKCAGCLKCVEVCPYGGEFQESGQINWDDCKGCMNCVGACLYGARTLYGRRMTAAEAAAAALRDKVFFEKSGGGVTVGGGEAVAQPLFVAEILRRCQEAGVHTALETCGYAPWPTLENVLAHVDLLLYDFKHMDSAAHRSKTGVGNERILDNAVKASRTVPEMIARFPLIPDFNDSEENVHALGAFIKENMPSVKRIDILRYHSVGEPKHARIGREYIFRHENELRDEQVTAFKAMLESYGLQASIGG